MKINLTNKFRNEQEQSSYGQNLGSKADKNSKIPSEWREPCKNKTWYT